MKEPATIEGDYTVRGERQPIIKSWEGAGALFALVLLRTIWVLLTKHH